MRLTHFAIAGLLGAIALSGCGGGSDAASAAPLQDGVYEFELTEEYMLENGLPADQAENESGVHEETFDNGSFTDRWRASNGTTGSCTGTYEPDGNRVTFKWVGGCFGDWAMTYTINGDEVTWSDIETLAPHNTEEDQKAAEVFNGVPWVRVGDAPQS